MRPRDTIVAVSFALHFAGAYGAPAFELEIQGIGQEFEQTARANVTLEQFVGREVSEAQARRLLVPGEGQIRDSLEAHGFYDAEVSGRLETHPRLRAIYDVNLGKPVLVTSSDVRVLGAAEQLPEVQRALREFVPRPRQRLDHELYESSKAVVQNALGDHGFLGARLETHRVEVTTASHSAAIDLSWESGPRYRFGEAIFSEAQFTPEFLQRFVGWREEDYFSSEQLMDLQRRLVQADYFSSVIVQPRVTPGETTVPVEIDVTPAKRNIYTGSLYASTDTGLGVKLGLDRRWLNARGHKFRGTLDIAQRLQSAELAYGIPLPGRDKHSFNFGASYRDETTDSSVSQTQKLVAGESREWRGFTRTLSVNFLDGDFEIGSEQGNSTLLYAEAGLARSRSNDPAFPTRGYSLYFGARVAPASAVASTTFAGIGLRARWLRGIGDRSRILLRGSIGAMQVDDFDELPPDLRFFCGGDRSVRGFDYQAIGSVNSAGDVIGGNNKLEGSLELEHYFKRDWGAAAFVDAGDAFRGNDFSVNVGVGMGLRWKSPVGVLRLDFAYPVHTDLEQSFRIHLTMGPDL
jgi:translocation and assembly module TamA